MADSLGLAFTAAAAGADATGQQEVELVPGGSQLAVTAGGVSQYVDALLEHKLVGSCSEQVRGQGEAWVTGRCRGRHVALGVACMQVVFAHSSWWRMPVSGVHISAAMHCCMLAACVACACDGDGCVIRWACSAPLTSHMPVQPLS
jgi:hypothetical protein